MTKDRSYTAEPPNDEQVRILRDDAGKGFENQTILDRAPWLELDGATQEFVVAISAVDNGGDQASLVSLLRSNVTLTREVRFYLADLLERHTLKRKRGKPPTPSYDLTFVQWCLEEAATLYRSADRPKGSRSAVLAAVVRSHLVSRGQFDEFEWTERLIAHLDGKRRQSRVVKKRRPPS